MNIFLSYASSFRPVADELCCRLQAVGHEVFFDREDLPAGESYDDRIRSAIEECELFIFLVAPESVAAGRYTRTEVKIASRKWPTPGWHVLPVQVAETPFNDVPPYLRALNIMQAEGNLVAEVVMEVEDRVRKHVRPALQTDPAAEPEAPAVVSPSGVRYRSVQLRFARGDEGAYSVAVPESPAGDRAAESCALDAAGLEQALWSGAAPIEGSAPRGENSAGMDALLPGATNAREVGQALYKAIFGSGLRAFLDDSLKAINPQRGEGLRFVINTTDTPDLARLPWEFLYSPEKDDFIFSDRMKPVVRWLDVDEPPPTLAVEPPLRLLMAIASPVDRRGLQVGEELAHLDRALEDLTASGSVETVRLEHATLETLDSALLRERPHVLHFIGHGDFIGDEGVLVLESDTSPGTSDTISGRQLAVLLRNHLSSLRLVFLNSCMGATVSRRDPFGGVAQSLIRRGVPAVIAMQFPIPDKAAIALARHFYRYLAAGQPVDAALTSARAFLYARGYAVEWGAPALHMRTPDGRLFDLSRVAIKPGAAALAPVTPSDQPTADEADRTVPAGPAEAERASSRGRGGVVALVVAVLLVGAAGIWWQMGRAPEMAESAPLPAGVEPVPPPVAAIVPAPQPAPAPAVLSDAIERALARLTRAGSVAQGDPAPDSAAGAPSGDPARLGEIEAAVASLSSVFARDPDALSAERLGARHAPLAQELVAAAEAASAVNRSDLAFDIAELLGAMAPLEPSLEARLFKSLEPLLITAAGEEPMTAAGESGERMTYIVRRGDTLWSIAARVTGDPRRWRELYERHNQAAGLGIGTPIANPHRLRPGQQITVPLSAETGANAIDYHVARGESLSSIALRIYGSAAMWRDIYRDNAERIEHPDRIRPGQILVLQPARRP